MKTISYKTTGITLCLLLFILSGCKKFVDRPPLSDISPENYLTDEAHLAAYTINQYNFRTQATGGDNNGPYTDDTHTDNQATRTPHNRFIPGQLRVPSSGGEWTFSRIYLINYYLNTVVPRYEARQITGNEANIKHYIGEGYMIRAQEYFDRLKAVGDFPIITTTAVDDRQTLIDSSKRMPRTEVARFILSDLDKAISLLNTSSPQGGKNRIIKAAAQVLKSRVALFEGTWLKYHKNTALVPKGPGWPGASKDYNKNYQFKSGSIEGEIDFFLTEAMAAATTVAEAYPLASNTKVIRTTLSDDNPYFDMFGSVDLNSQNEVLLWRAYSTALGLAHSANHYIFYDGGSNGYTRGYVDNFLMQNGLPIYAPGSGYAGDDYVQDVKVNRDWRLRLFMKAPGEVKALTNGGTILASPLLEGYPNVYTASDGRFNYATGYALKKGLAYDYTHQSLANSTVASVVFRAGEAHLNYIEACYEKNGSLDANAAKYWRAIRDRAGVNNNYAATIAATNMAEEAKNDWGAYSKGILIDPTLYNIRRERRSEFIGEGMRWSDLIRWRAIDQLATQPYQIEGFKLWGPMERWYDRQSPQTGSFLTATNVSSKTLSPYLRVNQIASNNLAFNGYKWTEAHYLNPIAANHFLVSAPDGKTIESSPIYQNPGWPTTGGQAPIGF